MDRSGHFVYMRGSFLGIAEFLVFLGRTGQNGQIRHLARTDSDAQSPCCGTGGRAEA